VTLPESRARSLLVWLAQRLVLLVVISLVGLGIQLIQPEGRPRSPIPIPTPPAGRSVHLAPIGDFPIADVEALASHYREKFGIVVGLLPSIPVPDDAIDPSRSQLIAERLIEAIKASHQVGADPGAVVIGLTNVDMYIAGKSWSYAFSLRVDDRFAVVSSARMNAYGADQTKQIRRLQKVVTKNIGVLYFGLLQNNDRGSVLYRGILGPLDLDHVSEDF
jgi:predicted Zn-dependent protease